jgi:hypothetical protein
MYQSYNSFWNKKELTVSQIAKPLVKIESVLLAVISLEELHPRYYIHLCIL